MPIHNKNSLLLSLAGGVLMILAGVSGAIGVIGELSEALEFFFGLEFFNTFENFMSGLAMWAALGGFVAILGGLILTTEKVRFGRMVILAGITVGRLSGRTWYSSIRVSTRRIVSASACPVAYSQAYRK